MICKKANKKLDVRMKKIREYREEREMFCHSICPKCGLENVKYGWFFGKHKCNDCEYEI